MISRSVLICAKGSAEASVSYVPFDICRAGIYRRQRNSCWSQGTCAISQADLPARRWPPPDRPEHRHRSQCTQWDRCTVWHFIERRASIVIGAVFRRMDTIHRAHIYTGSVFRPETGIGNDVGHQSPPMHGPYQPSKGVGSAAYNPT